MPPSLPIDQLRSQFLREIQERPVVITAPTGTGKSTQVPRWLFAEGEGSLIIVVQPRRVAARAVAARIAELEDVQLGREVGYRVRDDDRSGSSTRLLVVTPGILLSRPELLSQAELVVLDELHERRLDTDLLFALLAKEGKPFVAMSATMDGDAVAAAISGVHLQVSARTFPVDVSYFDHSADLPTTVGLETRLISALERLPQSAGDVLIFLPGKGEITRAESALSSHREEILPLHGGLTLKEQARVLKSGSTRRIILATNVAETSLTIPGVVSVIDAGLVRRTTYKNGRSYLTLAQIALDSADQRAGRAGRTAPGHCIRLWGSQARLALRTPPEIHREQLGSLVMTCAALGVAPTALPFLDAPKDYALREAETRLTELGAVASETPSTRPQLTDIGRQLFSLPLDPWLSRVLVEAQKTGCLSDVIDLVALLEQPRASALAQECPDEELQFPACDAEALVYMLREGSAQGAAQKGALTEARSTSRRLRRAFSLPDTIPRGGLVDRTLVLKTLLMADPACAHVARHRKKRIVFSNGGTEMEVGRESRVNRLVSSINPVDKLDAIVVLETHGISSSRGEQLLVTLAAPIELSMLRKLDLGNVSVGEATVQKTGPKKGKIVVTLERTFAGRLIETREEEPVGRFAREATVALFMKGALHRKAKAEATRRLARRALARSLGQNPEFPHFSNCKEPPQLRDWLLAHLEELGVENTSDLELLSETDFLPEDVPAELAPVLGERFPSEVDLGDSLYSVAYDLAKKQVTLSLVRGFRKTPPPANYLPRFEGLRVFIEAGGSFHQVRR